MMWSPFRVPRLFVCVSVAIGGLSERLFANDLTVCKEGCQYTSVRAAVEAAVNGDTIRLSAEKYSEGSTINTAGKQITILGVVDDNGDPASIISGEGTHPVFRIQSGETADTKLTNLKIINGKGVASHMGGGIEIKGSGPELNNCHFISNAAFTTESSQQLYSGGAAHIHNGADPRFLNCDFTANRALMGAGGGVYCENSSALFFNCTFTANFATLSGGGIVVTSNSKGLNTAPVTIRTCTFTANTTQAGGGAVQSVNVNLLIEGTTVGPNNVTQVGGAITVTGANATIKNCKIFENKSQVGPAAGVLWTGGTVSLSDTRICGNVVLQNTETSPSDPCVNAQINPGYEHQGGNHVTCDCPSTAGDFDQDGDVDVDDYHGLGDELGICVGDLNGDGVVDASDLGTLISLWGACP